MKKVLVLIWFCAMIVAAQAQVEKGVSSTGQLGTTGDTRSFVDEKGHIVTRPRLTRTGKIIRTTIASVITSPTGTVTTITAISGGNVLSDGGAEVTARGVCWSTSPNPTLESNLGYTTDGVGVGEFVSTLTGLLECTTYYVRAYATNSVGTTYGEQETFNTLPDMDYAINFGYSVDFGKVTIVSTSATSAVWKNSSNQTVGEWVSGTTPVLPVGTYTVELTSEDCGTNSITIDILSSPICAVELVNLNETGFTPSYSGKYINALKDIEENTYNVVQIGEQCWLKDNLRTTKFPDGTSIAFNTWSERGTIYYPNQDATLVPVYGYLYNWDAVMDGASFSDENPSGVQGVCPNGWHVPSFAEVLQLNNYVQSHNDVYNVCGIPSNVGKAFASSIGWETSTNECSAGNETELINNATGFSAIPAGCSYGSGYLSFGDAALFHSTTHDEENGEPTAISSFQLARESDGLSKIITWPFYGYSVRCVRNEGCELSMDLTANLANSTDFGKVTINSTNATSAIWKDADGNTVGTWLSGTTDVLPAGTYTVTLSADECSTNTVTVEVLASPICKVTNINSNETGENGIITQLADIETNSYNVLSIAGQCWTRENLRVTKFANGTDIALGTEPSTTVAYRYYPGGEETNVADYGYLYNASVANGGDLSPDTLQGACPDGWHVPSDAEWRTLTAFVSAHEELYCEESENNSKALSSTTGWNYADKSDCAPGKDASTNNLTGLGLLPSGDFTGSYKEFGSYAEYWSSSYLVDAEHPNNNEYTRSIAIAGGNTLVKHRFEWNAMGLAIRCVRGDICRPTMDYTINLGNSEDFGRVTINSTNATAASWKDSNGVEIGTWVSGKTDILPVGVYSVELTGPCGAKTITGINIITSPICFVEEIDEDFETAFVPTSYSPSYTGDFITKMKDIDDNEYNVVQFGSVCWIKENFKATHFANGTEITLGQGHEVSNDIAYYEYPANNEANVDKYGLLYNWSAAMRNNINYDQEVEVQGICPDGWHLLGGLDFSKMETSLTSIDPFICGGNEDWMAKSLAATTDWATSTEECAVGNELSTNNATGMSVLPAGYRSGNLYESLGNNTFFWLSLGTNSEGAICMKFYNDNPEADIPGTGNPRSDALSVRCIRGQVCDPAQFDYTINLGNSEDFGRVTINRTNAASVSWRDTNGVEIGTWKSGKTDVLPVAPYVVVLTNKCGETSTQVVMILSSPICAVETIGANETGSGKYISQLTDVDGNQYNVVQVLTQCWTRENLRAEKYADGTVLSMGTETSTTVPYRYNPNNDASNVANYGYLYNWAAVMNGVPGTHDDDIHTNDVPESGVQGICPTGWHMPTAKEYTLLTAYAIGFDDWRYPCNDANDGVTIKAVASTTGWNSSSVDCAVGNDQTKNNVVGFGAMPAGLYDGTYDGFGDSARYMTTSINDANGIYIWGMRTGAWGSYEGQHDKSFAGTVRCVRGEGVLCGGYLDYTINPGSSADFGRVSIDAFNVTSASWKDSNGVVIGNWTNGKTDILPVGKYTVNMTTTCGTTTSMTIEIKSSPICTVSSINSNETGSGDQISQLKDYDNNTYNVVQIGNQCFMRDNLKTKHFADGTAISQITGGGSLAQSVYSYTPKFNGDTSTKYGLVYSSYAALKNSIGSEANPSGLQGICPDGWHLPSKAEYEKLENYVSQQSEWLCNGSATATGKALCSTTSDWFTLDDFIALDASPNWPNISGATDPDRFTDCSICTNVSGNNVTGLTLTPNGFMALFVLPIGVGATYWTSTFESDQDIYSYMTYAMEDHAAFADIHKDAGLLSVRCIRGAGLNTPSVTTSTVSDIKQTTASCGGNVTSDGGSAVTARGVCWSTSAFPTINDSKTTNGTSTGSFTSEITGLEHGTKYYVRAYATNALGTFYGDTISFTTCTLLEYTINMGNSTDFGKITINSDDITEATWKNANGAVVGTWTEGTTDILPVGTYSVEYTNECGSGVITGIEILSSPICSVESINSNETGSNGKISQLKDVENNTYNVVQIGSQCWTKENMRTKTYANGEALVYVHDVEWNAGDNRLAYDYPNGVAANQNAYGLLYNWPATTHSAGSNANPSGVQGVCPDGWHVPSAAEYTVLTDYVSSKDSFLCGNDATKIAKALSANTCWIDRATIEEMAGQGGSLSECVIAYDLSTNNATGFSMPAAGMYRGPEYAYETDQGSGIPSLGLLAALWCSSGSSDAPIPTATVVNWFVVGETVATSPTYTYGCWSVRCVRGTGHNTPTVTTSAVSDVTGTTATCGGNVTSDGGLDVTARGVCWGTLPKPTIADNHTTDGTGTGSFTSAITGLTAGKTYYARAYATNALGTFYGDTVSFTTQSLEPPTVDLWFAGSIGGNFALFIGNTVDSGDAHVTDCGICWSTEPGVTLADNKITAQAITDTFTGMLSSMEGCINYYIRAYATSSVGTGYSDEVSIKAWPSSAGGYSSGYRTSGSDSKFGTKWVSAGSTTIAKFELVNPNNEVVYETTDKEWEVIVPVGAYDVKPYIECDGSYMSHQDVEASAYVNPAQKKLLDSLYFKPIQELFDSQPKYQYAFASPICRVSTVNTSTETEFDSPITGTYINKLTDRDGNQYDVVQIGNQCWMRQNLRTTQFADGTPIDLGTTTSTTTAYRYNPNDNSSNVQTYGYLYNWAAAMKGTDGSTANPSNLQGVCPDGWHMPSDAEWTQLTDYLNTQIDTCGSGMFDYEEVKYFACTNTSDYIARSMCLTSYWPECSTCDCAPNSPMTENGNYCHDRNVSDYSGFNAVPAGYYQSSAHGFGEDANFWSTTNGSNSFILASESPEVIRDNNDKFFGLSVRCVRGAGNNTPSVTTGSVSNITTTSATCGGNVTSDGGSAITARGICWSTSVNPTIADSYTTDGTGTGSFTSSITGLTHGTYYVRAYATNSVGTSYGEEESFTIILPPTVTTNAVSDITGTTATCGGNVTSDGGATVTACGVCWSTSAKPTIADSYTTDGTGTGEFTSSITGLTAGTTYYVRAYATNSVGTSYGNEVSFTTIKYTPTVTTSAVSSITNTTAFCGGNVTDKGIDDVTARGVCWSTSTNPTLEDNDGFTTDEAGLGEFTSTMDNLLECTTYYVRAYATNSAGTSYGEEVTFITRPGMDYTINYGHTEYFGTISINSTSASSVKWFNSNGDEIGTWISGRTDTLPVGTYSVKLFAECGDTIISDIKILSSPICSVATSIDTNETSFTPSFGGNYVRTMRDVDGNVYNVVQIGTQCWMKENLRTTRYNDNSTIALGTTSGSTTTAYRYYPNNDISNVSVFGYLYNWKAVTKDNINSVTNPSRIQGVCPLGWHVPSEAEFIQLYSYCNANTSVWESSGSGNILAATEGWASSPNQWNVGGTANINNKSGFTARPAGRLYCPLTFSSQIEYQYFGSMSMMFSASFGEDGANQGNRYAEYLKVTYSSWNATIDKDNRQSALSVRCARNY